MSLNKMLCTVGRFDIPIIQMQPPFVIDLLDSNVAILGSAMSGKTTLLKTLVNIMHKQFDEEQEQIFILDFGGALSEYQALPLVSAYFDNSNEEYVKRVFKIMDNILKENINALSGDNYRDAKVQPIHTTLIIDNLNAFIDEPRYSAYHEKLAKLCRDGLSKGITLVITAVDTKGITSYLNGFKQKIAFELPQDKYMEVFNGKVGQIGSYPGHGFANVTVKPSGVTGTFRMNLPYEVQCFVPFDDSDGNLSEETFYARLKEKFQWSNDTYHRCVRKYQIFPGELTRQSYDELCQEAPEADSSQSLVSVGLDYVDFFPVTIDLEKTHATAIYGKKEFGKTNLLNLLVDGLIRTKPDSRIVFFDDGRNQLKEIYNSVHETIDSVLINQFEEVQLNLNDDTSVVKKLSPLSQFYVHLNENYISLDKRFLAGIYGVSRELSREVNKIPDSKSEPTPFTVFVIQSKLIYLNTNENKFFINSILPQMLAVAEERGFMFIFSDVQKISDGEQNSFFNNIIAKAFLLDNIAEFAGERGQKTIFGNMDVKTLKEDYARCEIGDGYYYDAEADNLLKLKYIKH